MSTKGFAILRSVCSDGSDVVLSIIHRSRRVRDVHGVPVFGRSVYVAERPVWWTLRRLERQTKIIWGGVSW